MTFTRSPTNTFTYSGNLAWKRIFRRSSIVGDGGKPKCSSRPCEYHPLQSEPGISIAFPYLELPAKPWTRFKHHTSQYHRSLLVASSPHRPILQLKQHGRILPSLCRHSSLLEQIVEFGKFQGLLM